MTGFAARTQDKSMDEILASIRKVIADDMKNDQAEGAMAASNVIELTQMIQDDGSVVDLKTYKIQDSEANMQDFKGQSDGQRHFSEVENTSQHTRDDLFSSIPPELETQDQKKDDFDTAPELQDLDKNPMAAFSMSLTSVLEPLVSEAVIRESAAALSKLSELTQNQKSVPKPAFDTTTMGQQTLDGLMREMLMPLLKNWLDSNLPSLVKWIVTEEIQKILKQSAKF